MNLLSLLEAAGRALELSALMLYAVLWPLLLGFIISAIVQALVPRPAVVRALGHESVGGVVLASAFGAASSSCSYAAVAVARSLFRKGADFANSIVFEFASTNLVFELGLVLLSLLGWQFLGGEVGGGVLMIALLALLMRLTLPRSLVAAAGKQAEMRVAGRMEGHAQMDMTVSGGPWWQRAFSGEALTAVSHYFFMDLSSLWQDLLLGFLIAGAIAAWVPDAFWRAFFLSDHPGLSSVWGPVVGPLLAMITFVCSVGNVPLAAVLWNGGISFGGVIAFIFGDLIILPILDIYRRYYGGRMSLYLFVVSYLAMVVAGLVISLLFAALHLTPAHHSVAILAGRIEPGPTLGLDAALLVVALVLGARFLRTGGPDMLRMMESGDGHEQQAHRHRQ